MLAWLTLKAISKRVYDVRKHHKTRPDEFADLFVAPFVGKILHI